MTEDTNGLISEISQENTVRRRELEQNKKELEVELKEVEQSTGEINRAIEEEELLIATLGDIKKRKEEEVVKLHEIVGRLKSRKEENIKISRVRISNMEGEQQTRERQETEYKAEEQRLLRSQTAMQAESQLEEQDPVKEIRIEEHKGRSDELSETGDVRLSLKSCNLTAPLRLSHFSPPRTSGVFSPGRYSRPVQTGERGLFFANPLSYKSKATNSFLKDEIGASSRLNKLRIQMDYDLHQRK